MNISASRIGMNQATDRLLSRFRSASLQVSAQSIEAGRSPLRTQQRSSDIGSRLPAQQAPIRLGKNSKHKGQLNKNDRIHLDRQNRHVDLFSLGRVKAGETVEISLVSNTFDPVLQLIDRRRKLVLQSNDDRSKSDRNSYLRFEAEKRTRYQIRVTSFDANASGRYKLEVTTGRSTSTPLFDYLAGYGLVDAAAAVAAALRTRPGTNLPDVSDLWGLDAVNGPEAWAQGVTGKDVIVAVLDTGVDYNHKDLKDNIWVNSGEIAGNGIDDDKNGYIDDVHGWKFVNTDSSNLTDSNGHGTHLAGTIAAMNNDFGVTGVAYDAKIMPIKVLDARGRGYPEELAAGIRYAVDNGAQVLNLSLGYRFGVPTPVAVKRALKYAYKAGAIAVMASGNEGRKSRVDAPIEPAALAQNSLGIAVGAIKENRNIADFSNPAGKTPIPFVVGPGVKIKSTVLKNKYANYSGTSMATPHVAGIVALMLSANPDLTPDQVRQILIETANPNSVKLT